jgi:hypothetical protein
MRVTVGRFRSGKSLMDVIIVPDEEADQYYVGNSVHIRDIYSEYLYYFVPHDNYKEYLVPIDGFSIERRLQFENLIF